ncbi:VOC family protein [Paraburkholderia elongata]|uniref:VOC family protein n=1 Tax=Paraburkholderia elongata TaxID=2675747 RepID=A0A972NVN4_9BURK|nr:VOC family protein [Paraburkholderia elongata]NPT58475.1 VOC family protein [Paraburkholderia elongata]
MENTLLVLNGVHHTARPTWKLRETVEFYRDKLGLPLVHAISARGWGPSNHPDFLHFFFESGKGSTIAFFYYIGAEQPDYTRAVDDYRFRATHTAWAVDSYDELMAWRTRLEEQGIPVIHQIRHELIESLYIADPNGYHLEITLQERPMTALDSDDAMRTIEAAMAMEDAMGKGANNFASIDQVWCEKGLVLADVHSSVEHDEASLYVLDVPEFSPLVDAAREDNNCVVESTINGYWRIRSKDAIVFENKSLRLVPALWHSSLTGGFIGKVKVFDRYRLEIIPGVAS